MTQTLAPFKLLSPARRDAILDDLLTKRPSKGPVPHVVTDEESYCSRSNEYRTLGSIYKEDLAKNSRPAGGPPKQPKKKKNK